MMDRGHKATYTCKKLSVVKSLYRYALRQGIMKKDPAHSVSGPKKEKVLPTFLKEAEADKLFDQLEWDMDDIRDVRARTLLLLLYSTGIRRAEVVALRDRDVNLLTHEMKVTGKRRKQRIVPLGGEISAELQRYTKLRDEEIPATDATEALFRNDKGKQMTGDNVYAIVHKYLSQVTTQKKRSPHVLRHSFATAMLNHEAKLGGVQKLLGHESLDTTQIYTHVTFEELKRSYSKAHPRES
jgi:integrase/recombinase XerC